MSKGFQAGVVFGLIDGPLDRRIEEALDGRVEPIQRHQDADFLLGNLLCRRLEGIEDGPLATGRCRPVAPALRIDSKILWTSWNWYGANGIILHEVIGVLEVLEGHAAVLEGQLVLEDVALCPCRDVFRSSMTSGSLASRRDWMTSSTLALDSDSRVLKRP